MESEMVPWEIPILCGTISTCSRGHILAHMWAIRINQRGCRLTDSSFYGFAVNIDLNINETVSACVIVIVVVNSLLNPSCLKLFV